MHPNGDTPHHRIRFKRDGRFGAGNSGHRRTKGIGFYKLKRKKKKLPLSTRRIVEGAVFERREKVSFTCTEAAKKKLIETSRSMKIHESELFELAMEHLDYKTFHVSFLIDAMRAARGSRIAEQLGYTSLESWLRASVEQGIDGFDLAATMEG